MTLSDYSIPQIIRALGRGKKGTRDLSRDEAIFVMDAILKQTITGPQLGAFLMLMRVKEETPEEISGMVDACDRHLNYKPSDSIDVNWPAYAGKKKQPSWYLLAAKLLAQNGIRILIHGGGEHTEGRQYAQQVCQHLGISVVDSLQQAEQTIKQQNICYIALKTFQPILADIIDMKAELGLRSPVNTLVRHLNPLNAKVTLQGMFHPAYMPLHHESAKLLGQQQNVVIKGDGGEFEVRPDSETKTALYNPSFSVMTEIQPMLSKRSIRPNQVSLTPLSQLWNGDIVDDYGKAATLATAALVLSQVRQLDFDTSLDKVKGWWENRSSL